MPITNLFKLYPPVLPDPNCFTNPQALANDIVNGIKVHFASNVGNCFYSIGPSAPATPADRNFPWVKTDGASGAVEGVYYYTNGGWYRVHPVPFSSPERRIWTSTVAALKTYDGGEDAAVGTYNGPMWEVDTVLSGKFPFGVDDTAAVGATGGAKTATIAKVNLPAEPLSLTVGKYTNISDSGGSSPYGPIAAGSPTTLATDNMGSGTPLAIMPPYQAVYFIKRTVRKYIRG